MPLPFDLKFSEEKSGDSLMGISLVCDSLFSLAAFRILSLSLKLTILIIYLGVSVFEFNLFGTLYFPVPGYLFPSSDFGNFQP